MAFVKQRTKADCGVACLAMLCDVSYEKAYDAISWRPSSTIWGLDTKQLREGAERLGFEGWGTPKDRLRRFKEWHDTPPNSLLKIPHPKQNERWHWVVWRKEKVYDPARGVFKTREFLRGYRPPSSYMTFVHEGTVVCENCGWPTTAKWSGVECGRCCWTFCY